MPRLELKRDKEDGGGWLSIGTRKTVQLCFMPKSWKRLWGYVKPLPWSRGVYFGPVGVLLYSRPKR